MLGWFLPLQWVASAYRRHISNQELPLLFEVGPLAIGRSIRGHDRFNDIAPNESAL
jgi:hypothetical protein